MRLAYLLWPAAAAAVITLAACSGTNPGPAANVQACKDFAAYKAAESAGSFPAASAHTLSEFLTDGPGNVNTDVGESLRHDLGSVVSLGYDGNPDALASVMKTAAADCAVVKATDGASSAPEPPAGSKTAAQEIPAMKAAMTGASSVHIVGTLTEGSQQVSIDASVNGSDISGTFSENGGTAATIVVADGNAYVQINSSLLRAAGLPATDCSTLCGKYVQAQASEAAKFTAFTMSHLMREMADGVPSAAGDTTDLFEPATFEGHPVLQLLQAEDTADVARTGPPYPLFIANAARGSADGSLTFSEWNSVPPISPPAASQIVQI